MPGTIFRLPDITSLVRGVTFTIMPDGKHMRVPTMNRVEVRAQNELHANNQSGDVMQALQDILKGKKPIGGRAQFDQNGRVRHRVGRVGPPVRAQVREPRSKGLELHLRQPTRTKSGAAHRGL